MTPYANASCAVLNNISFGDDMMYPMTSIPFAVVVRVGAVPPGFLKAELSVSVLLPEASCLNTMKPVCPT
jgi:hypothetical protein